MTLPELLRKTKAFKFLDKKLDEIEKKGKALVKVCGTGYEYFVYVKCFDW